MTGVNVKLIPTEMRVFIMVEHRSGIPLAFVLAVAASVTEAAPQISQDQAQLLAPGSLKSLAGNAAGTNAQLPGSPTARISQWFNTNWFNCFSGSWRRC